MSGTSRTVRRIPQDARTIYVRLYSRIGSSWQYIDYLYTAGGTAPDLADMLTPVPGSTITTSDVTFTWDTGTNVTAYWLYLGTSVGGKNIYDSGQLTTTSVEVTGISLDGNPMYARLFSYIKGNWERQDYTYHR